MRSALTRDNCDRHVVPPPFGKMRELVETSGLLNRQGVTAFKGSNPFLSVASESQPLRGDAISTNGSNLNIYSIFLKIFKFIKLILYNI